MKDQKWRSAWAEAEEEDEDREQQNTAAAAEEKKQRLVNKVRTFLVKRGKGETLNEMNQILDNKNNVVVDIDKDLSALDPDFDSADEEWFLNDIDRAISAAEARAAAAAAEREKEIALRNEIRRILLQREKNEKLSSESDIIMLQDEGTGKEKVILDLNHGLLHSVWTNWINNDSVDAEQLDWLLAFGRVVAEDCAQSDAANCVRMARQTLGAPALQRWWQRRRAAVNDTSKINKAGITSVIDKLENGSITLEEFKRILLDVAIGTLQGGGKRLRKRRHTHKRHVSRTVGRRRTRGKTRRNYRRTRSAARRSRAHRSRRTRSAARRSKARHNRRRTRSAAHRSKAPRKRNRGKNTRKRN